MDGQSNKPWLVLDFDEIVYVDPVATGAGKFICDASYRFTIAVYRFSHFYDIDVIDGMRVALMKWFHEYMRSSPSVVFDTANKAFFGIKYPMGLPPSNFYMVNYSASSHKGLWPDPNNPMAFKLKKVGDGATKYRTLIAGASGGGKIGSGNTHATIVVDEIAAYDKSIGWGGGGASGVFPGMTWGSADEGRAEKAPELDVAIPAELVSAAKDMLEALKTIVDVAERPRRVLSDRLATLTDKYAHYLEFREAIQKARAAIAKAEDRE